ncbi:phosphoribosylanthranilate isomerase [Paradesulfitobacterium aromaticivorans]
MVRVKICGIRSFEEALMAVNAGADALGFVFAPHSKRYVDPVSVREITTRISPFVARVGVFVDSTPNEVERIAKISGLTAVQLHGDENPEDFRHLSLPLIKAVKVKVTRGEFAPEGNDSMGKGTDENVIQAGKQELTVEIGQDFGMQLRRWQGLIQGILVDSVVLGQFGGTGHPVAWNNSEVQNLFASIKALGIPLILAGGLSPENVKEGILAVHSEAVDVSSGVELAGRKDARLIREFIKQAQEAAKIIR